MYYISNTDVLCSSRRMVCECSDGLREDGVSCQKRESETKQCSVVESMHFNFQSVFCVPGLCTYVTNVSVQSACVHIHIHTEIRMYFFCLYLRNCFEN